jgi:hypothetical protein
MSVGLAMAAAGVMMLPASAGANGATKYGWWYEANAGLPVVPPPPPEVPPDGLLVQNGFDGPTAISALTFSVPSGAQLGPMTLKIAGTPTITQGPIACFLSPASAGYKAAEGGWWKDRPSYDCKKAQTIGSVDAHRTAASFNVDPFLANGTVAVVILAGGPADQIAFQKPDDSALQITNGDVSVATGAAAGAPDASGGGASNLSAQPSANSPGDASQSLTGTGASPLPPVPEATAGPSSPSEAGQSAGAGASGPPGYALAKPAAATVSRGWHTKAATGLGLTSVIVALMAWSLGYGPLGGRVHPLSVRVRPPSLPSE